MGVRAVQTTGVKIPKQTVWRWCLGSGQAIESGEPVFRPEPNGTGKYTCFVCGRAIAAVHRGGVGMALARHMK